MADNGRERVDLETGKGLIIERASLVSKTRRFSEWTYNIAAWAFWFLLMRPLIITALWYLGFRVFYYQMVTLEGVRNPEFFSYGFLCMLGIFLAMLAWNRYNVYRFRGVERRKSRGECGPAELSAYYKAPQGQIESLRNSRNLEIYFRNDETIAVECGDGMRVEAVYAPQSLAKHTVSQEATK